MKETNPSHLRAALQRGLHVPTRSVIFAEMLLSGELSAIMLAERLGLDLNTVAYHIRRLANAGLIQLTRQVAYRGSVREKFYQVTPAVRLSLEAQPQALTAAASSVTPQERRGIYLACILVAAHLLARAPAHYGDFDTRRLDSLFLDQRLGMVTIGRVSRPALAEIVQLVRNILDREWAAEKVQEPHRDFLVFAALPEFLTPEK